MGFCEFASLAEAAGSQHPHLKVCCLPEASSVWRRQAETLHSLLPCGLLQSVSFITNFFSRIELGLMFLAWTLKRFCKPHQSLSADPLAKSQEFVSTKHWECRPAVSSQHARVPTFLCPSYTAARRLLEVCSSEQIFNIFITIFQICKRLWNVIGISVPNLLV